MDVLFVYMNKMGDVLVEDFDRAKSMTTNKEFRHIATIEPRTYLETMFNKHAKIVSELMMTSNA